MALSDEETLTDAIATDEQAKEGVLVVLDKTPFYAEMGGQAADHGVITGAECVLRDVYKRPGGERLLFAVQFDFIFAQGLVQTARVQRGELLHQIVVQPGGGETFDFQYFHGSFLSKLRIG